MPLHAIVTLPDEKCAWFEGPWLRSIVMQRGLGKTCWRRCITPRASALPPIQIGVSPRLLVVDLAKDGEEKTPLFVANLETTWASEALSDYEKGCLSIPEYYEMVTRPADIKLRYLDRQGEPREVHASGLMVTCL